MQTSSSSFPCSHAAFRSPERWLFIDGSEVFGGHEVMLIRWVEELARQGRVTPRVLCRAETTLREKAAEWATPISLPRRPGRGGLPSRAGDASALFRVLHAERPELCVLTDGCLLAQPFLLSLMAAARQRFAIYMPITEPTRELGFRSGLVRDFAARHGLGNLPLAWIVLTEEQARSFAAWARVSRPVLVLPNAVAPRIEALAASSVPLASNAGAQRVLVFGRLEPFQKGLDLLLDFLALHAAELSDVVVHFVGRGPAQDAVARCKRSSPELDRLIALSEWGDPLEVMRAHDVLLLPSRFEGVPLVMLEAMALGLPVVASDLPGTRSFLPSSCLFRVGDLPGAFAALAALRASGARAAVIEANRATFRARASGTAFSAAVAGLTDSLQSCYRRS